ncbi:recombinase family protein [Actinomadura montaniterrae]|uniref:Resolvase/invertase-type recombinase catalytic domain-containing protein n=1 Tax=Actinomadura montaniterrae TaxID=1803903 RepID=A0A6L3VX47_9ACTN|nr:recombinase family protein [Actinomadura montaniterrae]KAB2384716.1 hypothetical protein F9B16_09725 [Actinomadura montaniterrae]
MLQPREYVLYLRKSKGRAGIARQRRETTKHIEDIGGRIVTEFIDEDTTAYAKPGQHAQRDDYARMLAFLRADQRRAPLGVAAWHTDRLNRSTADADELIALAAAGGHIVETKGAGTYDLSTATGRKRFRQDAVDAAYEVDHMTERIESAKLEAVAEGAWLGGRRPFGFKKDGERHKRTEAAAVDAGTNAVLAGVSVNQVAREWRAAGLTGTSGGELSEVVVRRILLRPRNAGLMVHRGKVVGRARWLPVLCAAEYRPPKGTPLDAETEEAWRTAAEEKHRALVALLTDPARTTTPGPERRWFGSGQYRCGYPLDGGECQRPVRIGTGSGATTGTRPVYRCSGEDRHVVRDAVLLDAHVQERIVARLQRPDAADLLHGDRSDEAPKLRIELAALNGRLNELEEAFTDGDLSREALKRGKEKLRTQVEELEERLAACVSVSALEGLAGEPDAAGRWEELDLHRQRAVLAALLKVTILPAPKGRPKGHRPGGRYFHPEAVRLEWLG